MGRVVVIEADAEAVEVACGASAAMRAISSSGVMPSASALSMIGVPCVSSAQTKCTSWPCIRWNRTQTSAWM